MKPIKVKIYNKLVDQLRDENGKFRSISKIERAKTWTKRQLRVAKHSALVVLLLIGAFYLGGYLGAERGLIYAKEVIETDNLTPKIKELKAEILDDLKRCESGEATEDDALIVYDSNKIPSLGLYQFQRDTVIYYYDKLYGQDITKKEAVDIALDGERSRQLASDILFTYGADDWWNCKNKLDLDSRIELINQLEN